MITEELREKVARADLLTRLSEAETGSRELDVAVGNALGDLPRIVAGTYYTASIDAALALVERRYDENAVRITIEKWPGYSSAEIWRRRGFGNSIQLGFHERPDDETALTICIALIDAEENK